MFPKLGVILDEYSAIFLVHCYLHNFNVLWSFGYEFNVRKIDKKMVVMADFSILFENLMLDSLVDGFS
jgi:hypothetical protein